MIPDARELPAGGAINWSNGFLPARHQGVVIRSQGRADRRPLPGPADRRRGRAAARELARRRMNRRHLGDTRRRRRPGRPHPGLRAGRPDAGRPSRRSPTSTARPAETLALYGVDRPETADFGRACLLARRLLERGVRFVQLFSGGTFGSPRRNWDGHEDMQAEPRPGGAPDRPARRRPAPRPAPPGPARRHAGAVHHRVRPDAVHPVGRRRGRHGPRPQPVRLHRLAGRRRPEARHRLRRDRRGRLEGGRGPRHLARLPRHRPAPARHRPRAPDLLPQRHPTPADERPRPGDQGRSSPDGPLVPCRLPSPRRVRCRPRVAAARSRARPPPR